jgi:hypothetical protein
VLNSLVILGSDALLHPLHAQRTATTAPAVIKGKLTDAATGEPVPAKIRVVETDGGEEFMPAGVIRTMPKRTPLGTKHYFYARGSYEIAVPPGRYMIEVVRGICHEASMKFAEVGAGITHVIDFNLALLRDMHAAGWYSGNTHTHYHLELDEDPDDRLRMVPPAEALDISVISYLIRNDSPYITNRYPIGRLPHFSRGGTIIDMGEEARNNKTFGEFGYGHCLFLNIPRAVEPVSTGLLSRSGDAPDFPTLSMLCQEARRIGGTTVWCHNGGGMEAPVAVALGHVDAFNVGDGLDADYERYYGLLNCGFRLPVSSGTDWWIYDHNRIFVQVAGSFSYESWLSGLRAGRTFVSNGPLIEFTVNGRVPGSTLQVTEPLKVRASALSRVPFERLEIVHDGDVIAQQNAVNQRYASVEHEIAVNRGGWIAARVSGNTKTHAGFQVYAHSSPVYFRVAGAPFRRASAAGAFIDEIEDSKRFIRNSYKFASQADLALALGRFDGGRDAFIRLVSESA